jgi:AI-2E family transporter
VLRSAPCTAGADRSVVEPTSQSAAAPASPGAGMGSTVPAAHNPNTAHPQAGTASSALGAGHHALIAQPHTDAEGPIAEAETVAAGMRSAQHPLGEPGTPLDASSAFVTGMSAAGGVAVTAGLVAMIITVRGILVLIGLALFLAIGLEPAVSVLARRWLPRWAAVVTVIVLVLAVIGGFVAAAIPPLARQAGQFVTQAPAILARWHTHQSIVGQLTDRLHLQQRLQQTLSGDASGLFSGLLGAGQVVLNAASSTGIVAVLIVYFVADLPRIRATLYRLVPNSREPSCSAMRFSPKSVVTCWATC